MAYVFQAIDIFYISTSHNLSFYLNYVFVVLYVHLFWSDVLQQMVNIIRHLACTLNV